MEVKDIIDKAVSLGACRQAEKATDWGSLCRLFFSPQGREFCKKFDYPPMEMLRAIKSEVEPYGIHVEKNVNAHNEDIALAGESYSTLSFSGTDRAYRVVLMHGAKATIKAENYAVVRVENSGGEYEMTGDGTARILL